LAAAAKPIRPSASISAITCVGLLVRKIVDRHVGAFTREGDGGGTTHSGVAARNERFSPEQAARAAIALFAVVRPRLHLAGETGQGCDCFLNGGLGYLVIGSSLGSTVGRESLDGAGSALSRRPNSSRRVTGLSVSAPIVLPHVEACMPIQAPICSCLASGPAKASRPRQIGALTPPFERDLSSMSRAVSSGRNRASSSTKAPSLANSISNTSFLSRG
jgi:hypothetical protein